MDYICYTLCTIRCSMLYALCFTILYLTIRCNTILYYTSLRYTTLHYTTLHYTTLHYSVLYCIVFYLTTLHHTFPGQGVRVQVGAHQRRAAEQDLAGPAPCP
eukprot:999972-Heterocapsa_arctica.AAC.1